MFTDSAGKNWYKGNLHTHTTRSDGRMPPRQVLELYAQNGYDFLALTDHWAPCASLAELDCAPAPGLQLLAGCEYNVGGASGCEGVYHLLAIGFAQPPRPQKDDSPQAVIDAIHAAGGLAGLAHPAWSLNTPAQMAALRGLDFTEVFNSVSDLPHNARPDSGLVLDMLACQGVCLPLAACDDAHFYDGDACRSFCLVQADSEQPADILQALAAGRFYASQGPLLTVTRQGKRFTVDCSPAVQIVCYSDRVWSSHRAEVGEELTHAVFCAEDGERFVRFEVCDEEGRRAWSQYYPLVP